MVSVIFRNNDYYSHYYDVEKHDVCCERMKKEKLILHKEFVENGISLYTHSGPLGSIYSIPINFCPFCGEKTVVESTTYVAVLKTDDKVKRNSESYCTPEVMEAIKQTRGDVR